MLKTAHIADFRHELRAEDRTNAKHSHHNRLLWELRSQSEHLVLDHGNRLYDRSELSYRKDNETFDCVGHRKCTYL